MLSPIENARLIWASRQSRRYSKSMVAVLADYVINIISYYINAKVRQKEEGGLGTNTNNEEEEQLRLYLENL